MHLSTTGRLIGIVASIVVSAGGVTRGANLYVNGSTGSDSNSGTSSGAAFKTIQKAIDSANAGDTIHVAAGVYQESPEFTGEADSGTSGQPITLVGEFSGSFGSSYTNDRKNLNNWKTIIDPGTRLTQWTTATDHGLAGKGVYKTTEYAPPAYYLAINDKSVVRLHTASMSGSTYAFGNPPVTLDGYGILGLPSNYTTRLWSSTEEKPLWDGLEALYGYDPNDNSIYLRLRDGRNPSGLDVTACDRAGIRIESAHHITIRGIMVRGGAGGISIGAYYDTPDTPSHNVIVENCAVIGGGDGVLVKDKSYNTVVRNNEITSALYGPTDGATSFDMGAWIGSTTGEGSGHPNYRYNMRRDIYIVHGAKIQPLASHSSCITYRGDGDYNHVYGNHLYSGVRGLYFMQSVDTGGRDAAGRAAEALLGRYRKAYDNIIHNMSSLGICVDGGCEDLEIFENTIYDCNYGIRFQDPIGGPVFVYLNQVIRPIETGTAFYRYLQSPSVYPADWRSPSTFPHPDIFIYHNSITGGDSALHVSLLATQLGAGKTYMLNNILSTRQPAQVYSSADPNDSCIDYNLLMDHPWSDWDGGHNTIGKQMWPSAVESLPDLTRVDQRVNSGAYNLASNGFTFKGEQLKWSSSTPYRAQIGAYPDSGYTVVNKTRQEPNLKRMLARWPLADGGGDNGRNRVARESVMDQYAATLVGDVKWEPESRGWRRTLLFPANARSAAVLADPTALETLDKEATISFWTNGDTGPDYYKTVLHLCQDDGSREEATLLRDAAIGIRFETTDSTVTIRAIIGSDPSSSDRRDELTARMALSEYVGKWNHWIITKKTGSGTNPGMRLYRNGELLVFSNNENQYPIISAPIMGLAIGAKFDEIGQDFDGILRDVRVYNFAMSDGRAKHLYKSAITPMR